MDQPAHDRSPVSAGRPGLRLGAGLFLATTPHLGLDEKRQPADARFHPYGALFMCLRSGPGDSRPVARRISYPIPEPVDRSCFLERPGRSGAISQPFATPRFVSLDSLDSARVAGLVSLRNRKQGYAGEGIS